MKLFTLSGIKNANKALLNKGKNDSISEDEVQSAIEFWKYIASNIKDWNLAAERQVNSWELREKYIHALEDFIGARISSISTSPERDDTILVENPFDI